MIARRLLLILPLLRVGAWFGLLLGALLALRISGNGDLALPAWRVEAWRNWLMTTDPVSVVFALVRCAAIAVTCYLMFTTVISILTRVTQVASLVNVSDAISIPLVRRLSRNAVAAAFVGMVSIPAPAFAIDGRAPDETPVLRHALPPSHASESPATQEQQQPQQMRAAPEPEPESQWHAESALPPQQPKILRTWTVKPEDSL